MCPFIFFCLFVATLFGWDRFWKRWENPWKILALETRVNWSNAEYWHTPSVSIPCDLSWTKHCVQLRDQRGRGFCGALDLCRFPVFSHTGCTFKMGPHQTCQAKRILCQDISFWLTDLSVAVPWNWKLSAHILIEANEGDLMQAGEWKIVGGLSFIETRYFHTIKRLSKIKGRVERSFPQSS